MVNLGAPVLKHIEKRIFQRFEAELEVSLQVGGQNVQVTTWNISCGGMFLKMDPKHLVQNESKNSKVDMWLHLPNYHKEVKLVGQVCRQQKGERAGVAVKFKGLYDDNILAIETYLKSQLN